jgi:hypothetical protein
MPYEFQIDKDQGIVFFTASGTFTKKELSSCLTEVMAHQDFEPGYSHLVDFTGVVNFEPGETEIKRRVEEDKAILEQLGRTRIALVSPTPFVYSMTSMYELLMGSDECEVRTFRDAAPAREWLDIGS